MSMLLRNGVPRKENGKIDFIPKKHHGWTGVIMLCGFLFPPLAVAARFGLGKDFCINLVLTLCGYIPGHGHNFFIQNIRNNDNKARTPKWATRYGLVDDTSAKRLAKKRQWVGRYNDRLPERNMYDEQGQAYTYDRTHRFEDGDKVNQDRAGNASAEPERFFGDENENRAGSRESFSLRQNRSRTSLRSEVDGADGLAPGSGEAERRRAKSKARNRGFLGRSKSGKADRHARSNQVLGDDFGGYNPSLDSFDRRNDRPYDADSYDGPEDPDMTVGKRYRTEHEGLDSKALPLAPATQPSMDIMNDNHQF